MESVWSTLKLECADGIFATRNEAQLAISQTPATPFDYRNVRI